MAKIIQFPGMAVMEKPEITKTETMLKNEKCYIELLSSKEVSGRDLTDGYNNPAFYNKTSRSMKKAWKALQEEFTAETTMHEALGILQKNNIRCHSYCMMD